MSALSQRLASELERARAANLYRTRRVVEGGHGVRIRVEGRDCVNFCSNDYLGLAADPRIAQAARAALSETGTGSAAAALVSGYNAQHRALEEELAAFCGRERALLFSTGWAANLGVLRALLGKNDTLIADELNHASLIDGGRLSGAHYLRVPHADASAYETAIKLAQGFKLVATDSVFSMDGDVVPLPQLAALCKQHDAALMVDDAHGFGAMGEGGRGACLTPPDIYVATLGKSLGCAGAFVAGDADLIEFLVQRARSWIFSTAPPPALAAAARRALAIVDSDEGAQLRARLHANIGAFRAGSVQRGIALGIGAIDSVSAIQPLVLGSEERALALSKYLYERGLWVAAIRPPTVPRGTARLRITLSAAHQPKEIEQLLENLASGLKTCSPPP